MQGVRDDDYLVRTHVPPQRGHESCVRIRSLDCIRLDDFSIREWIVDRAGGGAGSGFRAGLGKLREAYRAGSLMGR